MDSDISFEESSELFDSESNQIQNVIDLASKSEKLTISQIIQSYYQVMKVSSISKILKENFQPSSDPKHQELLNRIHYVQKLITENFTQIIYLCSSSGGIHCDNPSPSLENKKLL